MVHQTMDWIEEAHTLVVAIQPQNRTDEEVRAGEGQHALVGGGHAQRQALERAGRQGLHDVRVCCE